MTSRREFLQVGIAATTLPLATQSVLAAAAPREADAVPLYKVLYDVRFADSVAFARRAEARGAVTHAIEGDMTRFWYDDLYHRWRTGPAAIAGLTAHGPLFCLERLAWDQGLRVVFRAEHSVVADGVEHRVEGPVAMLADARRAVGDEAWSSRLADVVTQCATDRAEIGEVACRGPKGFATRDAETLYSWVIAPANRS
jgi:hypothetical protein